MGRILGRCACNRRASTIATESKTTIDWGTLRVLTVADPQPSSSGVQPSMGSVPVPTLRSHTSTPRLRCCKPPAHFLQSVLLCRWVQRSRTWTKQNLDPAASWPVKPFGSLANVIQARASVDGCRVEHDGESCRMMASQAKHRRAWRQMQAGRQAQQQRAPKTGSAAARNLIPRLQR